MKHKINTTVAIAIGAIAAFSKPSADAAMIVMDNFGGGGASLNGTTADTFHTDIVSAGGSSTWTAHTNFADNGVVSGGGNASAHLNMGTYINGFKGQDDGLFFLTMDIGEVDGSWISLGFNSLETPSTSTTFVGGTKTAVSTIIYRGDGELDMYAGNIGSSPTNYALDGPDGNSGARTLTVSLDLRTHNGVDDYGTVTWYDRALGELASFDMNHRHDDFGSIYISSANSSGTIGNLSLRQVPEPSSTALLGLGSLALAFRRKR